MLLPLSSLLGAVALLVAVLCIACIVAILAFPHDDDLDVPALIGLLLILLITGLVSAGLA